MQTTGTSKPFHGEKKRETERKEREKGSATGCRKSPYICAFEVDDGGGLGKPLALRAYPNSWHWIVWFISIPGRKSAMTSDFEVSNRERLRKGLLFYLLCSFSVT